MAEEEEVEETVVAEEEEICLETEWTQDAWIEISTKDQWAAAQNQDSEDHAKIGALDLTLTVREMISM